MEEERHGEDILPAVVSDGTGREIADAVATQRFSFDTRAAHTVDKEDVPPKTKERGRRMTWVFCFIWLLGLLGLTVPMAYHAVRGVSGEISLREGGDALCRGMLSLGLPPVNTSLFSALESEGEETSETRMPDGSETAEPTEEDGTVDLETTPPVFSETEAETEMTQETPLQSAPILTLDMSRREAGWDALVCDPGCSPAALSDAVKFSEDAVVLILHSHPYEAYGDGGDTAWHNGEGWAVKPPSDGVVALGEQLTLLLRLRGVRVIHAVVPADATLSHMDTYDGTKELLGELLSAYPQIAWVIDLRRGAELTEDGGVLRSCGTYGGEATAQLRISVDGGNDASAQGKNLRVALDLRRCLFAAEPTLSRPVYLRRGDGLCDGGSAVLLTLEFGTAGNTFAEAARLLVPVADAIATCMQVT